jgi:hypothetical protein
MQVITLVLVQIFTIDNILGSPVLMPGRVVDSSASIPFLNRPSRSMQSTASQMYLERTSPLNTCSVRQRNRLIHLPALGVTPLNSGQSWSTGCTSVTRSVIRRESPIPSQAEAQASSLSTGQIISDSSSASASSHLITYWPVCESTRPRLMGTCQVTMMLPARPLKSRPKSLPQEYASSSRIQRQTRTPLPNR